VTESEAIAGIQAVLDEAVADDQFSGAVLVAKGGQVLLRRATLDLVLYPAIGVRPSLRDSVSNQDVEDPD
jgi:hypothetical protein